MGNFLPEGIGASRQRSIVETGHGNQGYIVDGSTLLCTGSPAQIQIQASGSASSVSQGNKGGITENQAQGGVNIPSFGVCRHEDPECTIPDSLHRPRNDGLGGSVMVCEGRFNCGICVPDIIGNKWLFVESKSMLNGEPAVTVDSACFCSRGGMIYPADTGQSDPDALLALLRDRLGDDFKPFLYFGLEVGMLIADPININTGNFAAQRTDMQIYGATPLALTRTYNALDTRISTLGRGWRHSFATWLEKKEKGFEVTLWDGRVEVFLPGPSGQFWSGDSSIRTMPHGFYEMETADGDIYTFDGTGRCMAKGDANGNQTAFQYKNDLLMSVRNISGNFTFAYDDEGRLISVADSAGRTVGYSYDPHSLLSSVDDVLGIRTIYQYDRSNRIITISDSNGDPGIINTYDKKGRAKKQYYADGGAVSFEYDDDLRKTTFREQNRNWVRYYQDENLQNIETAYYDGKEETDYDDKGQKIRFRDKNGNETSYEYDDVGNLICETNPLGVKTRQKYDRQRQPVEITVADKAVTKLAYDDNKNIISAINPLGHRTQMQYQKGMLTQVDLPDGGVFKVSYDAKRNASAFVLPTGARLQYQYDALNRVTAITDGNGGITQYAYNAKDEITEIINADGKVQTYEYTPRGFVCKVTDFDGGVTEYKHNIVGKVEEIINQAGDSTKFTYDLLCNITSETDACGNTKQHSYDKLSRLVKTVDAEGNATCYEYDPKGNVTAVISPLDARTETVYDALDRQVKVTEPDGASTEFTYDVFGNLAEVKDALGNVTKREYDLAGQLVSVTDPLGNKTTLTYTPLGKVASITNAKGESQAFDYYLGGLLKSARLPTGASETYEYDKNENVIKKTDGLGNETRFQYDSLNRVIEAIDPLGHSKKFAYDALGNIVEMTDENGGITQYKYAPLGDIIEVIDASGHSTKYDYDAERRLTKLEQFRLIDDDIAGIQVPEYQITTYEYDKNGKIVAVQTPLGRVTKYQYDSAGNVISKLDGDGLETQYTYNLAGLPEKINFADGKTVEMAYNPLKQLTEVRDWLGITQIELDPLGRATQVTDFDGKAVGYAWDSAGRREKTIYPDGNEVRYSYNAAGLLEKVHAPEGDTRYAYDAVGRMIERILPDDTRSRYRLDPLGRIANITHGEKYQTLDQFDYSFDPAGNISQIKKQRKGLEADSGLFRYGYDPLGRLTSVTHENEIQKFTYDAFGNRLTSQQGNQTTRYAYNAANQLVQTKADDVVNDYRYDGRGNLTQITENGTLKQSFTFDATNRMREAVTAGVGQAAYTYDGFLNRVQTGDARHILDRTLPYNNLLMTEGGSNQRFTWGNELISTSGEHDMFYLHDHLGSPIRLMWNLATPLAYDAFGVVTKGDPGNRQPFGFTGYQADAVSGLNYAQARYHAPEAGRFVSEDVVKGHINMPKSLNAYTYCWNQPMTMVDLDGRVPCPRYDYGGYVPSMWNANTSWFSVNFDPLANEDEEPFGVVVVDAKVNTVIPDVDFGAGYVRFVQGRAYAGITRSYVGGGAYISAISASTNEIGIELAPGVILWVTISGHAGSLGAQAKICFETGKFKIDAMALVGLSVSGRLEFYSPSDRRREIIEGGTRISFA